MAKFKRRPSVPSKDSAIFCFTSYMPGIVILLFSISLYINTWPNNYNLDDELVTINHRLTSQGVKAIPQIFMSPYYSDEMGYSYDYRPLVHVSFAIEHQFFGQSPHISHVFNGLLYAICCLSLFFVLRTVFESEVFSLLIVLLFAAHSSHTEVVASIKNRDEILAFVFMMLALRSSFGFASNGKGRDLVICCLWFTASLLSKPTGISYIILVPTMNILFLDIPKKRLLLLILPLILLLFLLFPAINLGSKLMLSLLNIIILSAIYLVKDSYSFKIAELFSRLNHRKHLEEAIPSTKAFFQTIKSNEDQSLVFLEKASIGKVVVIVFVLLLLLFGLIIYNLYLFLTVYLLSIFLIFLFQAIFRWLAAAIFVFCTVLIQIRFPSLPINVTVLAGSFYMLVLASFAREKVSAFFYIPLITMGMLGAQLSGSDIDYSILFVGIILYRFRNLKIVSLLLLCLTFGITSINLIRLTDNYVGLVINFATYAFVLLCYQRRRYLRLTTYLLGLVVVGLVALNVHQANFQEMLPKEGKKEVENFVMNLDQIGKNGKEKAKNLLQQKGGIVPSNVDRPVDFVEDAVQDNAKLDTKIATGSVILGNYSFKALIPAPLAFYYGYRTYKVEHINNPLVWLSILLHSLLVVWAFASIRRNKILASGIFFFLFSLAPFTNILMVVPGMFADRYLFFATIGSSILLILLLYRLFGLKTSSSLGDLILKKGFVLVVSATLLSYSAWTIVRNHQWNNKLSLMRRDIIFVEESAQAHNLLALALMEESMRASNVIDRKSMQLEAIGHFRKALQIYPSFFNVAFDMGRAYTELDLLDSAINSYSAALNINPHYYQTHLNLANVYIAKGQPQNAISLLQSFIAEYPEQYVGYERLSFAYFNLGSYKKSIDINKIALNKVPLEAAPYVNIGRVFKAMGAKDSAEFYLRKALFLAPGSQDAENLLNSLK